MRECPTIPAAFGDRAAAFKEPRTLERMAIRDSVLSDGVRQLGPGLAQASGQVTPVGVVDPPVEASSKDRHSDVREQGGGRRLAASANQLCRECVGDGCELGPSPLLQLGAASDDLTALNGVRGDLGAEHRCRRRRAP